MRNFTGLFILVTILGSSLLEAQSSDTIPFEYFYGRIIGRTHITSIHDAYNDMTGSLVTSLSVGNGNHVSVNLGNLFTIAPTSQSNTFQLTFHRPQLSAAIQPTKRVRWDIQTLDWQDDAVLQNDNAFTIRQSNSSFDTKQAFLTLRKDVEYDPAASLYTYLRGIWLAPRNWVLYDSLKLRIDDANYDEWGSGFRGPVEYFSHDRQLLDRTSWSLGSTVQYGLSQRLQMLLELRYSREVQDRDSRNFDSTVFNASSNSEEHHDFDGYTRRNSSIRLMPTYRFGNGHWLSVEGIYANDRTLNTSNSGRNIPPLPGDARRDSTRSNFEWYILALDHTFVMGSKSIPRGQILDDWLNYYGRRLSKGSLSLTTSIRSSFGRFGYASRHYLGDSLSAEGASGRREDDLKVSSEIRYFSRLDIDVWSRFELLRKSWSTPGPSERSRFIHSEAYQFRFGLEYYSFRWLPGQRTEIGWEYVDNIDYLLGPLLRKFDWKAQVSVAPPRNLWEDSMRTESVFNFFKGESDDHWLTTVKLSSGLGAGMESEFGVSYDQWVSTIRIAPNGNAHWQADTWDIAWRLKWQPSHRFRLNLVVGENYRTVQIWETRKNVRLDRSEYKHTWRMNIAYNILI